MMVKRSWAAHLPPPPQHQCSPADSWTWLSEPLRGWKGRLGAKGRGAAWLEFHQASSSDELHLEFPELCPWSVILLLGPEVSVKAGESLASCQVLSCSHHNLFLQASCVCVRVCVGVERGYLCAVSNLNNPTWQPQIQNDLLITFRGQPSEHS